MNSFPSARVAWTEGMFLQPQHFQHQQRHLEWLLHERLAALFAFGWGFDRLVIDEAEKAKGVIALRNGQTRGILPDGTPFEGPDAECRIAPLLVPTGTRNRYVYLRAYAQRADAKALALSEQAASEQGTRYVAFSAETSDEVVGFHGRADLLLSRLRLALVLDDAIDGSSCAMPVARIVERDAGPVVLDEDYIPPLLDARASGALRLWLRELRDLVLDRAEMLALRLNSKEVGAHDVPLLQLCNRYLPLLREWLQAAEPPSDAGAGLRTEAPQDRGPQPSALDGQERQPRALHPQALHHELLKFAGECASFDPQCGRLAPVFPSYRHDRLGEVLPPLIGQIRRTMRDVAAPTAVEVPLRLRGTGTWSGDIDDARKFRSGRFVLGAWASIDDRVMRERLPGLMRICSKKRLGDLTMATSPGIKLSALPGIPTEIKGKAQYVYFELDRGSDHWREVEAERQIALLALGVKDMPDLTLELWYLRSGA